MVLKLPKQDATNQQDSIMPDIALVTKKGKQWLIIGMAASRDQGIK